jgi:hypothetical protein
LARCIINIAVLNALTPKWDGVARIVRCKDSKERNHGKRRDHQELEIVDVGNDLRLPRDHGNTG